MASTNKNYGYWFKAKSVGWDKVKTDVNQTAKSLRGLQHELRYTNSMADRQTASLKNLSGALTGLKAYGALVVTGKAIRGLIDLSNQYVENLNLFMVQMGPFAEEAKKHIDDLVSAFGINPSEAMRYMGFFMNLAQGMGVAGEQAIILSKNLTNLGYDLSSLLNIDIDAAMLKIQSGLAGELEPLRRVGYALSVNSLQNYLDRYSVQAKKFYASTKEMQKATLENTNANILAEEYIGRTVLSLTDAEKVQLRYAVLMEQTALAQGDMGRTLNTPANMLRILRENVLIAGMSLGNIFIPALMAVLPAAIAVTQAIKIMADAIAALFNFKIPEIDWASINRDSTILGDAVEDVNTGLDKTKKKIKELKAPFDELNVLKETDTGGGAGGVDVSGGAIGGAMFENLREYDDLIKNSVMVHIQQIRDDILVWLGLAERITDETGETVVKIKEFDSWGELLRTKFGLILGIVTTIGTVMLGMKIGAGLATLLLSPIGGLLLIGSAIGGIAYAVKQLYDNSAEFKSRFDDAFGGLSDLISGIVDDFDSLWLGFNQVDLPKGMFGQVDVMAPFEEIIKTQLLPAMTDISTLIAETFLGLFDTIVNIMDDIWNGAIWPILNAILVDGLPIIIDFVSMATEWIGILFYTVKKIFDDIWNVAIAPILSLIGTIVSTLFAGIATLWAEHGAQIVQIATDVFTFVLGIITDFWEAGLKPIFETIAAALTYLWENAILPLWEALQPLIGELIDLIMLIWDGAIKPAFSYIKEKLVSFWTFFSGFASNIIERFKLIIDIVANVAEGAIQALTGVIQFLKGVFSGDLKTALKGIGNIFVGLGNMIISVFEGAMNFVISIMNALIRAVVSAVESLINGLGDKIEDLAEFLGFDIKLGVDWNPYQIEKVSFGRLKMFEAGGFPRMGDMFVANEAGPELVGRIGNRTAVANTDQIVHAVSMGVAEAMSRTLSPALNKMVANGNQPIVVYLDGDVVYTNQQKVAARKGYNFALGQYTR